MLVARPLAKHVGKALSVLDIPAVVAKAAAAALAGRPGGAYIDIPADILQASAPAARARQALAAAAAAEAAAASPAGSEGGVPGPQSGPQAPATAVARAAALIAGARRPILVIGKARAASAL